MAIPPIDYIVKNGLSYLEGNVIRYVSRWRNKNGVEDLKKAQVYLGWLIEQRSKIDLDLWWRQYGTTWVAITEHIRPKFTPAEWDRAQPADDLPELLALLDGPREPQ